MRLMSRGTANISVSMKRVAAIAAGAQPSAEFATMGARPMQDRYLGSCHCGAVRFEIDTDFPELTMYECSICRRKSALMARHHR